MKKRTDWVYVCYLGKNLGMRTACIYEFVKEHDGKQFFSQYSTDTDSILEFIQKIEDKNLW